MTGTTSKPAPLRISSTPASSSSRTAARSARGSWAFSEYRRPDPLSKDVHFSPAA